MYCQCTCVLLLIRERTRECKSLSDEVTLCRETITAKDHVVVGLTNRVRMDEMCVGQRGRRRRGKEGVREERRGGKEDERERERERGDSYREE